MSSTLLVCCESPSVPMAHVRHAGQTDDPDRIEAFLVELETLFDAPRWERARARAAARRIAALKGLDPLWSEVLGLELANGSSARDTVNTLRTLSREDSIAWASFRDSLDSLEALDGVRGCLESLQGRFKLACFSSRGRDEAQRVLRALDLDGRFEVVEGDVDPGVLAHQLGERAAACVLVASSDSPALEAARDAGLQTVAMVAKGEPGLYASTRADLALRGFDLLEGLALGAEPCGYPSALR